MVFSGIMAKHHVEINQRLTLEREANANRLRAVGLEPLEFDPVGSDAERHQYNLAKIELERELYQREGIRDDKTDAQLNNRINAELVSYKWMRLKKDLTIRDLQLDLWFRITYEHTISVTLPKESISSNAVDSILRWAAVCSLGLEKEPQFSQAMRNAYDALEVPKADARTLYQDRPLD